MATKKIVTLGELEYRYSLLMLIIGPASFTLWGIVVRVEFPNINDGLIFRLPTLLSGVVGVALARGFRKKTFFHRHVLCLVATIATINSIYIQWSSQFDLRQAVLIPTIIAVSLLSLFSWAHIAFYSILTLGLLSAAYDATGWTSVHFVHLLNFVSLILVGVIYLGFRIRIDRELEQRRLSLEKINRENESLISLVALASHDIRSPIGALATLLSEPEFIQSKFSSLIQSANARLQKIAEEFLNPLRDKEFASPTTFLQIKMALVDLIEHESRRFRHCKIILDSNVETRSSAEISIDLSKLIRVVSNLVTNSAQAIATRGEITIRLRSEFNYFSLKVEDNGPGIEPQILRRLSHERGITVGKKNGNGLGLYSARQFTESWGGQLEISSVPGRTIIRLKFKHFVS